MATRLTGIPSLAYQGVNAPQPPNLTQNNRAPNANDSQNVSIGDLWLNSTTQIWMLLSLSNYTATWVQLYPGTGGGGASSFVTDSGTAVQVAGVLNVFGGTNINTAGSGQTVTVNLDNSITLSGTITLSSLGAGVVQTNSSGLFTSTNGSNGQVLIGGGTAPMWNNITSSDGSVTITPGVNSISLTVSGGGAVPLAFATDSGTATPAANSVTFHGINLLSTSGSGHTVSIGLSTTGTNGQIPISATSGSPIWNTITAGNGISIVNGSNTITISASTGITFWNSVSGTTQAMLINQGYVPQNVSVTTLTLPAVAPFGSEVAVCGNGSGGWIIAQNAGQTIHFGVDNTTTGIGGSLASTNQYDAIRLLCTIANTDWVVELGPQGNITVV